jgi:hypothetical protein
MLSRAAAVVAVAAAVLLFLLDVVLSQPGFFLMAHLATLLFALVGALLIVRVPRNPVGYLLCLSGVLFGVVFGFNNYAYAALVEGRGSLPFAEVAAVLGDSTFAPAVACIVVMLLFFPSGRGLGGWWTWLELTVVALVIAMSFGNLFSEKVIDVALGTDAVRHVPNPLAIHGPLAGPISVLAFIGGPSGSPVVLIGPVSLFVRYRRSSATEREQIKWLVYGATLSLVLLVLSNVLPSPFGDWFWIASLVALAVVPIAIAIAILRYRLYEIDVIIRGTLVYAAVSGVLLAAYVGAIAVLEAFFASFTAANQIAIAVSTVAVIALFQPVRRRVQTAVDRRFYRARFDAERILERFATRLRDEVDLDALEGELLQAVSETVQPDRAGVWLRSRQ